MARKAYSTQYLVNAYPAWSSVRTDEQSLGFQLMNSIGVLFDDLREQNIRIGKNYYLPTSIVSDIDVYYSYQLPDDYIFVKEDDDDTELLYTSPVVSGYADGNVYAVTTATTNSIEDFWYNAIPDRWTLGTVASGAHLLASGTAATSPLNPLTVSGLTHTPNYLYITVSGSNSCIGLEDNNFVRKGIVQVEGKTRAGADVVEELLFLHDDTIPTKFEYKSIAASGIRAYGIKERDTSHIHVYSANFNRPSYPTSYELYEDTYSEDDEATPLFWSVGSGYTAGTHTLNLEKYDVSLELRIEGFTNKQIILQQEVRTSSGVNIVPRDIAPEPNSSKLWIVDSGNLYLFNDHLPYPTCNLMETKQYNANSIIVPSSYYAVVGETITLEYVWMRPTVGLVRHRVSVVHPDGTKYLVEEDGTEIAWDSTVWVYGEPLNRVIRPSSSPQLTSRGQYIYTLEVYYTDDTSSIDQRIIYVVNKDALADYSLNSISPSCTIRGVDVDSEGFVWVIDDAGDKFRIDLHYDNMIIDFEKKVIYFREGYDRIRVITE